MRRLAYPVAVAILLTAAVAWFLLRPGVEVTSTVNPSVIVQCTARTSASEEACRDRGDAILAEGAPSNTFELEDVVRLRLDRSLYAEGCTAQYFLSRYPDEVVWTEPVACPGDG
jgi:hypothetical protein